MQYTGRAKNNNLLGKIQCLWNCSKFFHQTHSSYRGGFRPHILYISLQYFVAFRNYNCLSLNVHFSKWPSIIKLRNVLVSLTKTNGHRIRQISDNWIITCGTRCCVAIRNSGQNRPTLLKHRPSERTLSLSWRLPCYWYGMISNRSSLIIQSRHFQRDFDRVLLQLVDILNTV